MCQNMCQNSWFPIIFSNSSGHSMTTWTRRTLFWSTFRVKNVHVEVGGGQERTKLCPSSH